MIDRVKHLIGLFIYIIGFVYAFYVGLTSLQGETFVNIQEIIKASSREIANVNKGKLAHTLLLPTSPLHLLSDAKLVEPTKGSTGPIEIILGHYSITPPDSKNAIYACQLYEEVLLTYEGFFKTTKPNAANPQMVIKTPCIVDSKDPLHLRAIQILPQQITKDTPSNGFINLEDGSSLNFENMGDQWPNYWQFRSVQLKTNKSNTPLKELNRLDLTLNEQSKLDLNWMY